MSIFSRRRTLPAPDPVAIDADEPAASWTDELDRMPVGATRAERRNTLAVAIAKHVDHMAPRALEGTTGLDAAPDIKRMGMGRSMIPDALFMWFYSQGFIGHQTAAFLAQHWLIDKACSMPAKDAVRQGFRVKLEGEPVEGSDAQKLIGKANKRHQINRRMIDYVRKGRVFGIRIAIFKIKDATDEFYRMPFNIDAIEPGTYDGIKLVDPYWAAPEFDQAGVADPASDGFYDPTFWRIGGKLYHKSHLCIFRTEEVADVLKPSYMYGGVPVPQRIMERVYAAERTANEAPQLAMTKRLSHWKTDLKLLITRSGVMANFFEYFQTWKDNYGVKVTDTDDEMQVFDTSLQGLDDTIMTQYQIVAAASNVPATKLLGTTPKGFNSTGEYEESSYHEELETIQTNDLTPFLDRHHEIMLRSDIEPQMKLGPGTLHAEIEWEPLDSPTAKEQAEINKLEAETDGELVAAGAIDGLDVRKRIKEDPSSGYYGISDQPISPAEQELEDATAELEAELGGAPAAGVLPGGAAAELDAAVADLVATDTFDIPQAAGVILIRANGDALWLKRRDDAEWGAGTWAWPGGKIDMGEKPQDAAIRELYEETGINYGAPISPVGIIDGFVAFSAVSIAALEVTLNDEHVEYAWRPLSDPPQPVFPGCFTFLKRYG